jgi:hypothetical protein
MYAYGDGDPAGHNDPSGLAIQSEQTYLCGLFPDMQGCSCVQDSTTWCDVGGGGGGDGGGVGGSDEPDPGPAPPKCPDNILNFFDTMIPISTNLGTQWNSSSNAILALSAYESGWLAQHAQDLHNPFGLTKAGGNDLKFGSYEAAADLWSKNDGKYIQGIKDINQFADAIQPHYNTVNPAWKQTLKDVYQSVLKWRSICDR